MNIVKSFILSFFVKPEPIITNASEKPVEETPKTSQELQAELQALCDRVVAVQYITPSDSSKYEHLLLEIYKRGETPKTKLSSKRAK